MDDQHAFLETIRERPHDLTARLVFADWLQERDDPLATFIRAQFERAARDVSDPATELIREAENDLLAEHEDQWLGPLATIGRSYAHVHWQWRHGFVEALSLPVAVFATHAEAIIRHCPALREVTFYEVHGYPQVLGRIPELAVLDRIAIADRLTPHDAAVLAQSPHLRGLREFEFWIGYQRDGAVVRTLLEHRNLFAPKRMILTQLFHASQTDIEHPPLSADEIAELDARIGPGVIELNQPFSRLFPLRANVGRGLYAGSLPEGRQGLVVPEQGRHGDMWLLIFDADGNLIARQRRGPIAHLLRREPPKHWMWADPDELMTYLNREFGFELGLIHVREFEFNELPLSVALFTPHQQSFMTRPDVISEAERASLAHSIHKSHLVQGNFTLLFDQDYQVSPDGHIQS